MLFYLLKCISLLLISKAVVALGYVLLNELQQAIQPFLPSGSGGLAGGSAPLPGSPGPGGSSGIPNSFSWFYNHESPGQEVTSTREHVGSAEAGPNGTTSSSSSASIEEDNDNELSPVERRVKQRLNLEDPTYIYPVEDIIIHVEIKGRIVDEMMVLDPDTFWTEHRNGIISESILDKDGKEFTMEILDNKLETLQTTTTNSPFFRQLVKMRKRFQLYGSWNAVNGH